LITRRRIGPTKCGHHPAQIRRQSCYGFRARLPPRAQIDAKDLPMTDDTPKKILAVPATGILGTMPAGDGQNVLLGFSTREDRDVAVAIPTGAIGDAVACLLEALGQVQTSDMAASRMLHALKTTECGVSLGRDGSVIVTFQSEGGARIPFHLSRALAEGLSAGLAEALDGTGLPPHGGPVS